MIQTYRIADFCVQLENAPAAIAARMADYRIEPVAETAVDLYIDAAAVSTAELEKNAAKEGISSKTEMLFLEIYRRICTYALAHNAFLMHCAVIEYEGRGYAFSAPSGTGKTTHIRLWQKAFGADRVTVVNGEKPILRLIDGVFYAYGTPWCGKEGYNKNTRVPLAGLCFVTRGAENRIRPMSADEAIPHLFSQIMVSDSPDLARQMELADALLGKVPCYLLACNMDPAAAEVALRGMCKGGADRD